MEEPAVPPARARAADAGLEQHDPQVGRALRERERGPEPGVAAADDHDVGVSGAGERRRRRVGRRLVEPQDRYHALGFVIVPLASASCGGNWLAASTPSRIGLWNVTARINSTA